MTPDLIAQSLIAAAMLWAALNPRWSMTWTHSLTLTKQRRESGERRFGVYRIPGQQARYGAVLFGYALQLVTQKALRR